MAFPTTPIIDDFNRADNATSLGANWSSPIEGGYSSLGVLSNQCYPSTGFNDNYWNTSFAADQEAYATVNAIPVGTIMSVNARVQNPGGGAYSTYRVEVYPDTGTTLRKIVAGAATYLGSGTTISVGDSVGVECIGTSISLWKKPAAGAWALVETVVDGDVTGAGYIGLSVGDSTAPRFDDFGGGAVSYPVPVAWLRA